MKPHKHCELIKQWADGHTIEHLSLDGTWTICDGPLWNEFTEYRIHDPYRELKAAAADPTKQIRINGGVDWIDAGEFNWTWTSSPSNYEIRDKPVEKKKVKLLAWINYGTLFWYTEDTDVQPSWIRVPSEDKEVEV
jgi:hypothetical protein